MGSYPPSYSRMVERCTRFICGSHNPRLFDLVVKELLHYLNQPDLTADKLFDHFSDTAGSYSTPGDATTAAGEWLSWQIPKWKDVSTAETLAGSTPSSWSEILALPRVGPDTFYDMFNRTLFSLIREKGACLLTFSGVDDQYFVITDASSGALHYVKTTAGVPFSVDSDDLFVLPTAGSYKIRMAHPTVEWYDPSLTYQASELAQGSDWKETVSIAADEILKSIEVEVTRLVIHVDGPLGFHGADWRLAVVEEAAEYSAWKGEPLYNKKGKKCTENGQTPCKKFAFRKQEEMEGKPLRTVGKPSAGGDISLYELPDTPGKCDKVLVYCCDKDIVVATVAGVDLDRQSAVRVRLPHTFHLGSALDDDGDLPSKAMLQGDIIRQYQQETSNCGTFSLGLAMSYWAPFKYNPLARSGKWIEDEHGDWPPWTGQGTMEDVAGRLGFNRSSATLDGDTKRARGLRELKRWIAAGIPVIVNIDEYQDTTTFTGEHYKVLIGYDDKAVLHYTKKDVTEGSRKGALYFANSGAKGLDEGDPGEFVDGIPPTRRENHEDYDNVPIGNDVDSYRAFWYKWQHGGYWPVTSDLWYLPIYPRYYRCGRCQHRHDAASKVGRKHFSSMERLVAAF